MWPLSMWPRRRGCRRPSPTPRPPPAPPPPAAGPAVRVHHAVAGVHALTDRRVDHACDVDGAPSF
jgi:hypothetical protein